MNTFSKVLVLALSATVAANAADTAKKPSRVARFWTATKRKFETKKKRQARINALIAKFDNGDFRNQTLTAKANAVIAADHVAQTVDRTSRDYRLAQLDLRATAQQFAQAQKGAEARADKDGLNGWFFGAAKEEINKGRTGLNKPFYQWFVDHKGATAGIAAGVAVLAATGTVAGIAQANRDKTDKWLEKNPSLKNKVILLVRKLGVLGHRAPQQHTAVAA